MNKYDKAEETLIYKHQKAERQLRAEFGDVEFSLEMIKKQVELNKMQEQLDKLLAKNKELSK